MADPYGWHEIDRRTLNSIREKLGHLESRTWGEILNSKHNHNVSVDKLSKGARDRLAELKQHDIEELLSLRLSGAERIWGILAEGVGTILWWDPNHRVCPSLPG
jgi:hypothetical protein